ncbi:MAG: P-loop NTPase family protein, partial [Planctomycetota bacterium]
MRRIAILGCAGAGKSTLALQIGESLGIEVIHLDRHFWKPGWVETPREEWAELQTELLAGESWVADGNYGATLEIRLARADTILFMDMPRRLCLWRILKRRIRYRGRARPDVAPGCPENVDWEFFRW